MLESGFGEVLEIEISLVPMEPQELVEESEGDPINWLLIGLVSGGTLLAGVLALIKYCNDRKNGKV